MYMLLYSYKYLKYFLFAVSFTINLEGDEDNSIMFIDLKIFKFNVSGILV